MTTLIGLGGTGAKLVEILSSHPQYKIIKIDADNGIKKQKTAEEYEKKCPSFKAKFKNIKGDVYFFVSAAGNISGASLRILEQLRDKNVHVICIHSDTITLSSMGILQQKLVSNVLQEYARSGLIKKLYLLDNTKIEQMIEDVSLDEYWEKINELICYVFHTMMFFKHTKPMMESAGDNEGINSIATFGTFDINKNKKMFYDLKHVTSQTFYYSYSKERDKKNKNFLKNVKEDVAKEEGISNKSFKIYESDTEDKTTYIEQSTHILQYIEGENEK